MTWEARLLPLLLNHPGNRVACRTRRTGARTSETLANLRFAELTGTDPTGHYRHSSTIIFITPARSTPVETHEIAFKNTEDEVGARRIQG